MKYFVIRPIRGITKEYEEKIEKQLDFFRRMGYTIYDPLKDTDQDDDTGLRICKANLVFMKNCDEVLFMWDGKSQGCLFDLGMAFALGKKIRPVSGLVPEASEGKSFQNMVQALLKERY